MKFRVGDGLWIRPVDVGAALAARSYAADGDLVLEVADEFCPWNDGRYALDGSRTTAEPRPAALRRTRSAPSISAASASPTSLRAGRIEEVKEGAIARADALFRTDGKPWCPEIF